MHIAVQNKANEVRYSGSVYWYGDIGYSLAIFDNRYSICDRPNRFVINRPTSIVLKYEILDPSVSYWMVTNVPCVHNSYTAVQ